MKLAALNIQHGGGRRIPSILGYLSHLEADVLVLTEFRENRNAAEIRTELISSGYVFHAGASINAKENSVAIFSRLPFVPRTYAALPYSERHRLVSAHFEALTVYGVYFAQNQLKSRLFEFLLTGAHAPDQENYLVIGDFNTGRHHIDEEGATFACANQFEALENIGLLDAWRSRHPTARTYSWYSRQANGFRIDHVLASHVANSKIVAAEYDHTPRYAGYTDHSALLVESNS